MSNGKRKMFYAVVEFKAPAGNMMTILADDEDHARKLLADMHSHVTEFRVVDLHDMDNNPEIKAMIEAQMEGNQEDAVKAETIN